MSFLRANRLIALCLLALGIVGCGGGGGESNTPEPSTPTTPVTPTNSAVTGAISITGSPNVGSTLTVVQSLADANGLGTFSYQWLRAGQPIPNATEANYVITSEDMGQTLTVTVSYVDGDGFNESVTSEAFAIAQPQPAAQPANILFIISDDQGLDASSQYPYSSDTPNTPNLDRLAAEGVVFDNLWVTPACTTTRATILTGKHGVNSGVSYVPAALDSDTQTLAKYLKSDELEFPYSTAAFGKWHLGGGRNIEPLHPNNSGFDHFAGNLANIDDYYNWELTVNGQQSISDSYHTTEITDRAISWISEQTSPWFVWLAYQAPHSPFHLPPQQLHQRSQLSGTSEDISDNPREYFLAAIDAIDAEVGRLIRSLDAQVLDNTVIVYIGDNGTPSRVIDPRVFQVDHGKSTLYEGGIRAPLIMSGKMVTRVGERETALVNATDLFTTLGQVAGLDTAQLYDSKSFFSLLSRENSANEQAARTSNYSEFESDEVTGWTITDGALKLIHFEDGSQQLFDISQVLDEGDDIIANQSYDNDIARLQALGQSIRGELIDNSPLDITEQLFSNRSRDCASYAENYQSSVMDVNNSQVFSGSMQIRVNNDKCIFTTNAIPNHDFNDGNQGFPNRVAAQDDVYEVPVSPRFADSITALSLRTDNAILLNGVKVDLLAAGCFGIGNGKTGCGDVNQPWRYDPMFVANGFNVDSHNAHAQSDGTYHYHGNPNAFYAAENTGSESPVIGFAADGFPIFGPYFDDNGSIRKATSSYQLKAGFRPDGDGEPGGEYNGAYRDDYEYIDGSGDLDECNGMAINGTYGYYVTDGFPYILACFKGTPDPSFDK